MLESSQALPLSSPKLLVVLIVLVIAFNLFAFKAPIGLGLGIFCTSVIVCFLVSAKKPFRRPIYALAVTGIIASLFLSFRANGFIQTINILTALSSITSLLILNSTPTRQWHFPWLATTIASFATNIITHTKTFTQSLLHLSPKKRLDPIRIVPVVSTTLILILIFTFLLAKADPLFQKALLDLFKNTPTGLGQRIFSSLLIALSFSFFITLAFTSHKIKLLQIPLNPAEIVIPLTALIGLFSLFLFIQTKYLFVPQDQFLSLGVTYSEYVRRGFKELMATSALAGIIVYFTTLTYTHNPKRSSLLKLVNSLMVIELFFLLASAHRRNILYINAYDLSRTRFIGEVFLVWLSITLALLLAWNLLKKWSEKHLITGMAIASVATLLFFNLTNMDRIITRHNISQSEKIDLFYPSVLSEDASGQWPTIIDKAATTINALTAKPALSETEARKLANAKLALIALKQKQPDKFTGSIKNFNWSKSQAKHIAAKNDLPQKVDQLLQAILEYQSNNSLDLSADEMYILRTLKYPFVSKAELEKVLTTTLEKQYEQRYNFQK